MNISKKSIKRWLGLLVVILLMTADGIAAGQGDEITLVPFTDETYNIQGVVPEGWQEVSPGLYLRGARETDVTLVAQQASPGTIAELRVALAPQFGLDELPPSTGTYETAALTWEVYQVETSIQGRTFAIDAAFSEVNNVTYIALLQATPEEYAALHESVFIPMVDAFAPYTPPVEDLPYIAEDVTFPNGDITLAGTLTLPEGAGPHPVVVLVSGSGPQDRDESLAPVAEIKPFRLIADHLTRNGIAVLRYDDRGVAESGGEVDATIEDYGTDTAAAIDYLLTRPEIDPAQIGILGHSEGGFIAAELGANNPNVAFIIAMAGPAVSGMDALIVQNERLYAAEGATEEQITAQLEFVNEFFAAIQSGADDATLREILETRIRQETDMMTEAEREALGDLETYVQQTTDGLVAQYTTQWFRSFVTTDPTEDWAAVTVPVLAVFGGLDVQVDATQNATALEAIVAESGNPDVEIVTIETANHLFQAAETGALSEYASLGTEFHPDFLPLITDWLLAHVTLAGE